MVIASVLYLNAEDKFVIITVLYNEDNAQRIQEYKECLEKNLGHDAIEKIHIIYDTSKDNDSRPLLDYLLEQKNVSITYYPHGRPTFRYCFDLANQCYAGKRVMLMNADIFFDDTLNKLLSVNITGCLLALTRWDLHRDRDPSLLYIRDKPNHFSQDVWIFQTPIRHINCRDLKIGTLHCEGQLARAAKKVGLSLYNPCLSITCYHLHFSGVRHWEYVRGPARMVPVPWCPLEDVRHQ